MPLTDKARLVTERDKPWILELWQALVSLRSVISFMNTGAHPDDESSAMLAALRFRDGVDISYACSTRGEGGQNDIGTERGEVLGALRTAEMEAACDRLDMRMYWHSTDPNDTISDFGFSKSGIETLDKWGCDRTLARFVDILRTERPDIICPTFLDVPGQHGHHRAMTKAAREVMILAADPAYSDSALPTWQVKKLYLPAWSGAGQSYDDDLPPPPATIEIRADDQDPVSGWSFAHIGQQSRMMHATQAMGRWIPAGTETNYPLHLAESHVSGPDVELGSGLARTLSDLDIPSISIDLKAAQINCEAAIDAFPDGKSVLRAASAALSSVRRARAGCPDADRIVIEHKLKRKEEQLAHVIRIAAGVRVRSRVGADILRPGDEAELSLEIADGGAEVAAEPVLPDGWAFENTRLHVGNDVNASDPYPSIYLPGAPSSPCISVSVTAHGVTSECNVKFENVPLVAPRYSARLSPATDVVNIAATRRTIRVSVSDIGPNDAVPALEMPKGWKSDYLDGAFEITLPADVSPGLFSCAMTLDGNPASSVVSINHRHVSRRQIASPARVLVRVVEAALPDVRVCYVGGGNDAVAYWLDRLGANVTDLSDVELTDQTLAAYDTLVVGIFALRFRPELTEARDRIHAWAKAGGTLVTLYHRPWDNWDADKTAPYRLEIGQPSLRWRVTNEAAEVKLLAPEHSLLRDPNPIGDADWDGWHKERGLYFAKDWDAAYTPLFAMQDSDEVPLKGAMLVADVGAGRHIHTSLILHHQMEKLVPGAFRIFANLLANRG